MTASVFATFPVLPLSSLDLLSRFPNNPTPLSARRERSVPLLACKQCFLPNNTACKQAVAHFEY